ncbi:cytochrome c-type biogenesis protein [Derxia gummosa]|uniref:Cytochrome c-type biogenesis protein n=1 Tax=Derxia gummosa DSM 723 TaxID=1121388 RepID=A0A9U5CWS9_9BURK|nr:cytochrome c-type biogenesis protein [Derxia gummosa]
MAELQAIAALARPARLAGLLLAALLAGQPTARAADSTAPDAGTAVAEAAAPDRALDDHVRRLAEELRCVVCQNQTLAESHAQLALDLKAEVRAQLARGASDDEVKDFLVSRYGDFVLYRPPVRPATWLLWGGPLLIVGAGLALLVPRLRRQAREGQPDDGEAGEIA